MHGHGPFMSAGPGRARPSTTRVVVRDAGANARDMPCEQPVSSLPASSRPEPSLASRPSCASAGFACVRQSAGEASSKSTKHTRRRGGLGLAYGAAGVLWALHTVGAPVDPHHGEWLLDAVARLPCRPGLYTGAHGVAFALDRLGGTQAGTCTTPLGASASLGRRPGRPVRAQGALQLTRAHAVGGDGPAPPGTAPPSARGT